MAGRNDALRAVHAYRAAKDREWSRTLRRFGYHASAAMVEDRAARHERAAGLQSQEAPPELPDGAASASLSTDSTQD